jgi:uncharacterized protein (TIRG00374 family)
VNPPPWAGKGACTASRVVVARAAARTNAIERAGGRGQARGMATSAKRPEPREEIGDRLEHAIEHRADVAGEVERGTAKLEPETRPGAWRRIAIRLAVTGVSLYVVAPSILDAVSSWPQLRALGWGWLAAMAALELGALASLWVLQHVSLRAHRWRPVVASQLASNAASKVIPGGGAVGAAVQYRMLVTTGAPAGQTVAGLTTANLLTFAVLLAMPVFSLPAILKGNVDKGLLHAAVAGVVILAFGFVIGAVMLWTDRPLRWIGRVIQRVRNRLRRRAEPLKRLPDRLVLERDRILEGLGRDWWKALLASIGRWGLDLACLVVALHALGSLPRLGLVTLAFCAAQLLAQIPLTPGGLGFVEAGLSGTLALAGVPAGDAVVASFAYRLCSYWLQLPLGLVGLALQPRAKREP